MSDIAMRQTDDGGEIDATNGLFQIDDGPATAAFLSLFGGNEDDNGLTDGERDQWWGNFSEPVAARRYRSETQFLMRSLAAVPANLRRLEDAAMNDLAWMRDALGATIGARATIPAVNAVRLQIAIEIDGRTTLLTFDKPKAA